jgi:hypothetical protein
MTKQLQALNAGKGRERLQAWISGDGFPDAENLKRLARALKVRVSDLKPARKWKRPSPLYDFDALKHGDQIEVQSKASAREMCRRWSRSTGRRGRLVSLRRGKHNTQKEPGIMVFLNEDPV